MQMFSRIYLGYSIIKDRFITKLLNLNLFYDEGALSSNRSTMYDNRCTVHRKRFRPYSRVLFWYEIYIYKKVGIDSTFRELADNFFSNPLTLILFYRLVLGRIKCIYFEQLVSISLAFKYLLRLGYQALHPSCDLCDYCDQTCFVYVELSDTI